MAALPGAVAAQTDPCQGIDAEIAKLEELVDTVPSAQYILEDAQNRNRICHERVAVTEHERLLRERSAAGRAYVNITPGDVDFWAEREEAREAWNEANDAVRAHETANPHLAGTPYNDGLSDVERYYCVDDNTPREHRVTGQVGINIIPEHGDPSTRHGSGQNARSVTCWH